MAADAQPVRTRSESLWLESGSAAAVYANLCAIAIVPKPMAHVCRHCCGLCNREVGSGAEVEHSDLGSRIPQTEARTWRICTRLGRGAAWIQRRATAESQGRRSSYTRFLVRDGLVASASAAAYRFVVTRRRCGAGERVGLMAAQGAVLVSVEIKSPRTWMRESLVLS